MAVVFAVSVFTSCTAKEKQNEQQPEVEVAPEMSLEEIMDALYTEVETEFPLMPTVLDQETFEFFSFAPYKEGYEGIASEAAMSAIPHSVVLIRVSEDQDAASLADVVRENANPRKWVCVQAERTTVVNSKNLVLLVMSTETISNKILDNFKNLTGAQIPEQNVQDEPETEGEAFDEQLPAVDDIPAYNPDEETDAAPEEIPDPTPVITPEATPEVTPEVTPEAPASNEINAMSFEEIVEVLYNSEEFQAPMHMTMPLDEENFEFFAFAPYKAGYDAAVNEPMMGSFAHSVVMVRLPEGEDVAAFAKQMKDNADPRKWICVEAEVTTVVSSGNFVMLVMSNQTNAKVILDNFNELAQNVITH